MDSVAPVYTLQTTEFDETRYISHIYIKDFVYVFRRLKIHGKAAFVRYAFAHVKKTAFLLVHSDGAPD